MALTKKDKNKALQEIRREEQQDIKEILHYAVFQNKRKYKRNRFKSVDPSES